MVSSLCCLGLVAALMVWPACSPAHLGPLALSVLAFLAFSSGLHLSALIGVANRLPRQYRGAILLGMVSDKTGKTNYLVSSVAKPGPVGSETFAGSEKNHSRSGSGQTGPGMEMKQNFSDKIHNIST